MLSFAFSFLRVDAKGRHCSPPSVLPQPFPQTPTGTRRPESFQKPVVVIPTLGDT